MYLAAHACPTRSIHPPADEWAADSDPYPYPKDLDGNGVVFLCGHASPQTYGATSYLLRRPGAARAAGGAPGDAPAPVASVGVLGGFGVLPGDQGQDADSVRGLLTHLLLGQIPKETERVTDQGINECGAGLLLIPDDPWFARVAVVVRGALHGCHLVSSRNLPDDRADGGDELGDGVLRATASSSTVESSARRCLPLNTPMALTISRTASNTRFGRVERASRRRK
ncbi:hypothetical protein GA0115254_114112 [Streptomyces sp. Ncost-T10-10d]|nr:hypothetical protein GA0115254_114112 [Streptomyces sp. Ncost-T10-10d]